MINHDEHSDAGGHETTLTLVQDRRREELARLSEALQARDLLEKRLSFHLASLAAERKKAGDLEQRAEMLEKRAGGSRFDRPAGSAAAQRGSWLRRRWDELWWKDTVRRARRAHKARALADAQLLFDAALVVRETVALWTELAHVLREQQLFDAAERAYNHVLASRPEDPELHFLAGYCAELSGNTPAARRHYEDALALDASLAERYDHLRDFQERLTRSA